MFLLCHDDNYDGHMINDYGDIDRILEENFYDSILQEINGLYNFARSIEFTPVFFHSSICRSLINRPTDRQTDREP